VDVGDGLEEMCSLQRGLRVEIGWMTALKEWSLLPKVIYLSVVREYFSTFCVIEQFSVSI
jgi:hypothetical protein